MRRTIFALFVLLSTSAWSNVFVHWTRPVVPPIAELGINDLVLSWTQDFSSRAKSAHQQGYRVYVEVSLSQARALAETDASDLEGIILKVPASDRSDLEKSLSGLRSAHPKAKFLLKTDGKQPQMRGSLVVMRDSVLEVSSPTAQPWIDTNLALVKVEQRSHPEQNPLYTFTWQGRSESGPEPPPLTAEDYSLAVAEAGAFHADLVLEVEDQLQKRFTEHDPQARALWQEMRRYANFYSHGAKPATQASANVAVIVDDLDPTDEVMNLLARHNIPFKVLRPSDLTSGNVEGLDVLIVFAKTDQSASERLGQLATEGATVVLVDAHAAYPWHNVSAVHVNEQTVSYAVGKGKVLELAEPVTDPETFAQDIRRLLGTRHVLLSLWNGLTTIAVPYNEIGGPVKVLEFVNYAGDPVRLQVQVKGSFASIRYESPERQCCESLVPVKHDGFTEFVIPELWIAGRVHLEPDHVPGSSPGR